MILVTITNESGWLRRYESGGDAPRLTHSCAYGCYVDLLPATINQFYSDAPEKFGVTSDLREGLFFNGMTKPEGVA
jgi:hypothetical protein